MTYLTHLECHRCRTSYEPGRLFAGCPACAAGKPSNVYCRYDLQRVRRTLNPKTLASRPPSLWKYLELLPVDEQHIVSLGEGYTPLIPAQTLGRRYGVPKLLLKDESRNPTWSFKDRLAAVGTSKAKALGCTTLTIASTGNAGAATAAYAARAGLRAVIFTTQHVPLTMRALMQTYGALVAAVPTMADRWMMVKQGVEEHGWFPVQNYAVPPVGANPYALEGAKAVGFELCEQLDYQPPDVIIGPYSAGDLPVGAWLGFLQFQALGFIDRIPRMIAAEVFGPLANALARGLDHTEPVPTGPSVAVSAAVANSAYQSLRMLRETGGSAETATDEEIMAAQLELAETEGIYAEPAAVLPLAVLKKLAARGDLRDDETVVALVTSTGLKDPEATRPFLPEIPLIEPTWEALEALLEEDRC
jgi:threonine synthase